MRYGRTCAGAALALYVVVPAAAQAPAKPTGGAHAHAAAPGVAECTRRFGEASPVGAVESWIGPDDYPQAAARRGIGGAVRFRVNVGVTGRVENVEILESADPILSQATQRVLTRRARFRPAMRNCQPVPGEYEGMLRWTAPE